MKVLDISSLELITDHIKQNFCGIYICYCLINHKYYLGSTISFKIRFKYHVKHLNLKNHDNQRFINTWYKYGSENFVWYKIRDCKQENLTAIEQYYLDTYQPWNDKIGLNISRYADSIMRDRHHSIESRKKMSESQKELRKRVPHPRIGMKHSEESLIKMSISQKNRIRPANAGEGLRKYYKENGHPLKGRKLSPEKAKRLKEITDSRKEEFIIVSPFGELFKFKGMKLFCRENHISINSLRQILRNEKEEISGWRKPTEEELYEFKL